MLKVKFKSFLKKYWRKGCHRPHFTIRHMKPRMSILDITSCFICFMEEYTFQRAFSNIGSSQKGEQNYLANRHLKKRPFTLPRFSTGDVIVDDRFMKSSVWNRSCVAFYWVRAHLQETSQVTRWDAPVRLFPQDFLSFPKRAISPFPSTD